MCLRDDLVAQCGQPFRIRMSAGREMELQLKSVTSIPALPAGAGQQSREPFSVIFEGPPQFVLPQRIYTLSNAGLGAIDIFIVPIGPEGEQMRYQAVFN